MLTLLFTAFVLDVEAIVTDEPGFVNTFFVKNANFVHAAKSFVFPGYTLSALFFGNSLEFHHLQNFLTPFCQGNAASDGIVGIGFFIKSL